MYEPEKILVQNAGIDPGVAALWWYTYIRYYIL